MQVADRERFAALMSGISDYYGKELSNAVINLYWYGLEQYDFYDVRRALWAHTQSPDVGQHLPKIADITRTLQGGTQDQAAIAWSKVDRAIRVIGTYIDVVFDDALIHRVITELGGWIWLGKQNEAEWPFVAKRFEGLYRGYRQRAESPPYPPQLIGVANAHNAIEGHPAISPLLVGDPAEALRVHQGGSALPLLAMHRVAGRVTMQNMALILQATQAEVQPKNPLPIKEIA